MAGGTRLARAREWTRTHPGLSAALAVPVLVFLLPTFTGHSFLNGDNLLQNFPLRVLVGNDLDHGIVPLFDPYLFSGTPLLAGFNAGAAYPVTWLFAVLPVHVAWAIDLALPYDVALVGMYLYLRRQGVSSSAATFGAVTFSFGGYMAGQIVHIDLVTGASWLPWMLLAVDALTDRGDVRDVRPPGSPPVWRRDLRWGVVLAVSLGLSMLAGAPEAIIDSIVAVVIVAVGKIVTTGLYRRERWRALTRSLVVMACAAGGAAVLSAAQWLPGLVFTAQSQRATATYTYFTSGSLPSSTASLLVSPFLLGTNQPIVAYFGPYNYPEVTSYVGVLALIAGLSLLSPRWRRRPEARSWWVWYVMLGVGMLSALGGNTLFGHLMYLVPGVRSERLLNRNLLLVDFALAVLLAWWVHLVVDARSTAVSGRRRWWRRDGGPWSTSRLDPTAATPRAGVAAPAAGGTVPSAALSCWQPGRRFDTMLTCLPLAAATTFTILAWTAGRWLGSMLGLGYAPSTDVVHAVASLATGGLVVAAVATWLALTDVRWSAPVLRRSLAAVLVVDLALLLVWTIAPPVPDVQARAETSDAAHLAAIVGDGRFIVYDPYVLNLPELYDIGDTDLNLFEQLHSAQGYAALVGNHYYQATGSHELGTFDPQVLAGSTPDELNVRALASLPSSFTTPVADDAVDRGGIDFPASVATSKVVADPVVSVAPGARRTWYFGGTLTVDRAAVPLPEGGSGAERVGLVAPTGGVDWLPSTAVHRSMADRSRPGELDVELPASTAAAGLVLANGGSTAVAAGVPEVLLENGGDLRLDGPLQQAVDGSHWVYRGTVSIFGVFVNTRAKGWAWAVSPDGSPPPTGTTVDAGPPPPTGTQRITVHASGPVTLVRSVAWEPGWHASVRRSSGSAGTRSLPVTIDARGAIQQVSLPGAGTYVVTFTYRPAVALVGIAASGVAGLAFVAWAVVEVVDRRRRRRPTDAAPSPVP